MKLDLRNGDCLEVLKTLEDNSIDSIVTDPPYGLAFMNKHWDYDVPSIDIWIECLRVLKPGGHLLSFGGSRTYHRMACAIEDAGFEIRDQIMWIYGSGFPKSRNVGKDVEKVNVGGLNNLKQIGTKKGLVAKNNHELAKFEKPKGFSYKTASASLSHSEVATTRTQTTGDIPVYEITNEFQGWGTALKPAHEPIVVARKPLSEKSVADNMLKWKTGGINIDASRIPFLNEKDKTKSHPLVDIRGDGSKLTQSASGLTTTYIEDRFYVADDKGRFPSNLIFDEESAKLLDEQSGPTSQGHWPKSKTTGFGEFGGGESSYEGVGSKDKNVNKQGASRFFYCAKVSKRERNEGLDDFEDKLSQLNFGGIGTKTSVEKRIEVNGENAPTTKNNHPTVKPISLMTYLIKLVTPVNGIVLDPFMGSGSTGKAAVKEGFSFVGIEREKDYFEIAKARIDYEHNRKTN